MPARSPATCRHAVSRRISGATPGVGIWVSDAMLQQAIERYRQAAALSRRCINSHAGPLEHRRRAARRHMTGSITTSQIFPSVWQLDIGPSALQWEPPTSPEHRRQRRRQLSLSGLVNSFVGWLESSDDAASTVSPPSELMSEPETAAQGTRAAATDIHEQGAAPHVPEEISQFRLSIFNGDATSDGDLLRLTNVCVQSLRRTISRGLLSAESLPAAWAPVDRTTRSRIATAGMANKMTAIVRRGLLSALIDSREEHDSADLRNLWLVMLDKLCSGPADNHDIWLFWRLVAHVPPSIKKDFSLQQVTDLTRTFVTAQANRHNLFAHWTARNARFSEAIQCLSTQQREALNDHMATFLLQQDWVSERAKRLRFSWLMIKAHDAQLTTDQLIRTYFTCTGQELRLNGLQRWQFMAARLGALDILNAKSRRLLYEATYTSMADRWSELLAHVMCCGRKEAGFEEVCAVLAGIGEFASTMHVLTSPPLHRLRRDVMQQLALACNSHKLALQLYDAIDLKPRPRRCQPLWTWRTWTKHIEAMIKDDTLDPMRIWQVLKLAWSPRRSAAANEVAPAEDIRGRMRLLDQMGRWFAEAPHLSDRQALRNVQRCVHHQRMLSGGGVSSQTLVNVTSVVSRDLERGQRGRTTRMRWLLGLVAQSHGPQHAETAASALRGWRWTLGHEERRRHPS